MSGLTVSARHQYLVKIIEKNRTIKNNFTETGICYYGYYFIYCLIFLKVVLKNITFLPKISMMDSCMGSVQDRFARF